MIEITLVRHDGDTIKGTMVCLQFYRRFVRIFDNSGLPQRWS